MAWERSVPCINWNNANFTHGLCLKGIDKSGSGESPQKQTTFMANFDSIINYSQPCMFLFKEKNWIISACPHTPISSYIWRCLYGDVTCFSCKNLILSGQKYNESFNMMENFTHALCYLNDNCFCITYLLNHLHDHFKDDHCIRNVHAHI